MILEILFHDEVQADDLHLVKLPTRTKPGQALFDKARLGPVDPRAPNARPVLSRTGAKIGFLAQAAQCCPPFHDSFEIPREEARVNGAQARG